MFESTLVSKEEEQRQPESVFKLERKLGEGYIFNDKIKGIWRSLFGKTY